MPQQVKIIQISTNNVSFYRLIKPIEMSAHNICFAKKNQKSTDDLFLKVDCFFVLFFSQYFEKPNCTVQ